MMSPHPDVVAAVEAAFGRTVPLEPMTGGKSGAQLFWFAVDGAAYVVRKTTSPTDADRELTCMTIASELGVAPHVVRTVRETGVVIMAKVDGTPITRATPRDGDPLGRIASTLRTLHDGPRFPMGPRFATMFAGLAQLGIELPPRLADALASVVPIVDASPHLVSCHGELNPGNILATPDHIYLIDWELAAAMDPFVDLAQLGMWVCRDAGERASLIASYLEREPNAAERERARVCRILALGFYAAGMRIVTKMTGADARLDAMAAAFERELDGELS
jgi:hypothetical protein